MTHHRLIAFVTHFIKPLLLALDWITPLATLLARCWVGYVFLKSGLLKLEAWDSTIMLFTYEYQVPFLPANIAAILGTAAETCLPVLIILGLGGRLSVLSLFLFNLMAALSYPFLWTPDGLPGLIQHINWGVILMLLMSCGTGKLSLDRFIVKIYKKSIGSTD